MSDALIAQDAAVFQKLLSKLKTAAAPEDMLLLVHLGLHLVDGVAGADLPGDGLVPLILHEDLHRALESAMVRCIAST